MQLEVIVVFVEFSIWIHSKFSDRVIAKPPFCFGL